MCGTASVEIGLYGMRSIQLSA